MMIVGPLVVLQIYLGNSLISWGAKKQSTIACSSPESEYKALTNTTVKLLWIQSLLKELGISFVTKLILWCDDIGVIYMTFNPVFHARTKHIELDYHFFCEQVNLDNVSVGFLSTKDQIDDISTKPLGVCLFQQLFSNRRLVPHTLST